MPIQVGKGGVTEGVVPLVTPPTTSRSYLCFFSVGFRLPPLRSIICTYFFSSALEAYSKTFLYGEAFKMNISDRELLVFYGLH